AGIHSGDSACAIPTFSLSKSTLDTIREWTIALAKRLQVVGLMNVQYAVQVERNGYHKERVFILEANPRASRTVPYVSKAIGVPLVNLATKVMAGYSLPELGFTREVFPDRVSIKEAVLPFAKFPGTDTILGPEMRSTGEVMGIDTDFGRAYAKAQIAAGQNLPLSGTVFISVNERDKRSVTSVAEGFAELGFRIIATEGTYRILQRNGIPCQQVLKLHEGRPHIGDAIRNGQVQLIVNTPSGSEAQTDAQMIRRAALLYKIPVVTTIAGAKATIAAIRALKEAPLSVQPIQEFQRVIS
ncbi:MAG: carbamoyl phosphate synthase large subunit, partial [Pseudanabaenaceae cyanobacterium]